MKTKAAPIDFMSPNKVDVMVEKLGGRKRVAELARGAKPNPGIWAHLPPQQPSTMRIMAAQKEGKAGVNWDEPIEGWKGEKDAEKLFRDVNKVSMDDLSHAASVRHATKNELGMSEKSAFSEEKRENARHHFMVTPAVKAEDLTPEQVEQITGITPIKSEPPPPLELKKKKTLRSIGRSVMEMIGWKK